MLCNVHHSFIIPSIYQNIFIPVPGVLNVCYMRDYNVFHFHNMTSNLYYIIVIDWYFNYRYNASRYSFPSSLICVFLNIMMFVDLSITYDLYVL